MKIIFLNPNTRRFAEESNSMVVATAKYLPYSLISCATLAKNSGFDVSVLDAAADSLIKEQWGRRIEEEKPVAVVVTVSAVTCDLDLAGLRELKKTSGFKLIALIVFPSFTEDVLKRHPEIDVGIGLEWAWALLDTLRAFKSGLSLEGVRGIFYREGDYLKYTLPREHVDINKLPTPDFKLLPMKKYDEYTILSSVGCNYRCLMCPFDKHLKKWEGKSAEAIIKEMEMMVELGGNKKIVFLDNEFTLDSRRTREFCQRIIKEKKKIYWACNTRATTITKEMAKLMSRAGCMSAALGVESGVQEILDKNNKELKLSEVIRAVGHLNDNGILSKIYLLVGLLGETKETIKRTYEFAKSIPAYEVSYSFCIPYKESIFFKLIKSKKWIKDLTIDNIIWIHKNIDHWPILEKSKGKKPIWRIENFNSSQLRELYEKYNKEMQEAKRLSLIFYFLKNPKKNLDYFYNTNPFKHLRDSLEKSLL